MVKQQADIQGSHGGLCKVCFEGFDGSLSYMFTFYYFFPWFIYLYDIGNVFFLRIKEPYHFILPTCVLVSWRDCGVANRTSPHVRPAFRPGCCGTAQSCTWEAFVVSRARKWCAREVFCLGRLCWRRVETMAYIQWVLMVGCLTSLGKKRLIFFIPRQSIESARSYSSSTDHWTTDGLDGPRLRSCRMKWPKHKNMSGSCSWSWRQTCFVRE